MRGHCGRRVRGVGESIGHDTVLYCYTVAYNARLDPLYGSVQHQGEVNHGMGALRTPREKWVDTGLGALESGGLDAESVGGSVR